MWFIYFVVGVGLVLGSFTLGAATYFERAAPVTKTSLAGPPPLPRPKPKVAGDNVVEDNTVREPKTVGNSRKERRSKVSHRRERW
jgi:hypothetical protein